MTHEEVKILIERYHDCAQKMYENTNVKISKLIKHVELSEDGAFVEAMVYIPKDELERRK